MCVYKGRKISYTATHQSYFNFSINSGAHLTIGFAKDGRTNQFIEVAGAHAIQRRTIRVGGIAAHHRTIGRCKRAWRMW